MAIPVRAAGVEQRLDGLTRLLGVAMSELGDKLDALTAKVDEAVKLVTDDQSGDDAIVAQLKAELEAAKANAVTQEDLAKVDALTAKVAALETGVYPAGSPPTPPA